MFDSGVGGLTIWQHIRALAPDLECHYLFDNALFPYGELPQPILNQRVLSLLLKLLETVAADAIVIACNTASTSVLNDIRLHVDIPVIGVVPAIKPAAALSQTKHIALLATPATVTRQYTDQLAADFAPDCRITRLGVSELVHLAEHYLLTGRLDEQTLAQLLKPISEQPDIDTVVLGCTHFPLVASPIASVLTSVRLVDSGYAVAQQVMRKLARSADEPLFERVEGVYYATKTLPNEEDFNQAVATFGLKKGRVLNLPL
ncbi:glutamate racemase [Neiella marina]|uniref:Glutamate racemase n=1 Tax=Neiella holothuriorum TaxID=2870530 RepID=A0ABS7EG17_9GAMM|nr:glutamate racemase [Neiella holothuriorum]MBW8191274.1 glutamate racemase [Neiella holothuriorum]